MVELRKVLLKLLQGDAGAQFAASNDGWDEDTEGKSDRRNSFVKILHSFTDTCYFVLCQSVPGKV
jgi:hypothetical protein